MSSEARITDATETQIVLANGFSLIVDEPLDEVVRRLADAAGSDGRLVRLTSAAFVSSVSADVYVNPRQVSHVIEMPSAPPRDRS